MAKGKTKEILMYYGKGLSNAMIAKTIGVSRNTVGIAFSAADKAERIAAEEWNAMRNGAETRVDEGEADAALRRSIRAFVSANCLNAGNSYELRSILSARLRGISNDELNGILFPADGNRKDISADMERILGYLTEPGTNVSDSYAWAREQGLEAGRYSMPHYQRLFRDYRRENGISDRARFKPGETMEIRCYRLETNEKKNGDRISFPAAVRTYKKFLKDENEEEKDRKGRWLFVLYFPFSRMVSLRVCYRRSLDHMVEAINDAVMEFGAPRFLVSDAFRTELAEPTRDWELFSLMCDTYGMTFMKNDRLCVFEEMEGKLLSHIGSILSMQEWYRGIANRINQLEASHNASCRDADLERNRLRIPSGSLVHAGTEFDSATGKSSRRRIYSKTLIVQQDSHVKYHDKKYSCPYRYVGSTVILSRTMDRIMLFDAEEDYMLISEHPVIKPSSEIRYSTRGEHMPVSDEERLKAGMYTRGTLFHGVRSKALVWVCGKYLDMQEYEEQGYEKVRMLTALCTQKTRNDMDSFCRRVRSAWEEAEAGGVMLEKRQQRLLAAVNELLDKAYGKKLSVAEAAEDDGENGPYEDDEEESYEMDADSEGDDGGIGPEPTEHVPVSANAPAGQDVYGGIGMKAAQPMNASSGQDVDGSDNFSGLPASNGPVPF